MKGWLSAFGLELDLLDDAESAPEDAIGLYEAGSVFSKTILVHVYADRLRNILAEDDNTEDGDFETQYALTVFHEVGHALLEQIVDFSEFLPGFYETVDTRFHGKFFDVLNDDNVDEEKLAEDFAAGFLSGKSSLLQQCWEECDKILEDL